LTGINKYKSFLLGKNRIETVLYQLSTKKEIVLMVRYC